MPGSGELRAHILAAGWRQGSVFKREDLEGLTQRAVDRVPNSPLVAEDRLVVLTQDCDLVHKHLEDEPWVDVIPARPITTRDPNRDNPCLHGKSPRRLVFKLAGADPEWWSVEAKHRFRIPRQELQSLQPDPERGLPPEIRADLARWMARRYTRAGFADAFNARLKPKERDLEDLWKSEPAKAISGIFILGALEELATGAPYKIKVLLAYTDQAVGDPELNAKVHALGDEFQTLLEACPDIEVEDLRVDPERDVTLADLRSYSRMDKDYRSPSDSPLSSRAPDELG
jgi:hypothetical protein